MLIDFRTLFPKYGIKPTGVLHVGANIGEEAPVYAELGITNVIWIEANHKLMPALNENISKFPGQIAFNYCVGDENKDTVLHISNNAGQSSSVLQLEYHVVAHPEVDFIEDQPTKMWRLDSIPDLALFEEGLDFLNMDIQGAELMALKGMGKMLDQFQWAYLEVNKLELYRGCALVEEIDAFMGEKGFTRVETHWAGNTGWGDCLMVRLNQL